MIRCMPAKGHQRRWAVLVIMSAFPLRPDLRGRTVLGRFVPILLQNSTKGGWRAIIESWRWSF
jgi:hypothetical protein